MDEERERKQTGKRDRQTKLTWTKSNQIRIDRKKYTFLYTVRRKVTRTKK